MSTASPLANRRVVELAIDDSIEELLGRTLRVPATLSFISSFELDRTSILFIRLWLCIYLSLECLLT